MKRVLNESEMGYHGSKTLMAVAVSFTSNTKERSK